MIDARGRVVIPGINDAHVHIGARPPGVDLEGPPVVEQDPSLDEILQRVKAAVAKAPAGGWIYGDIGSRVLDDDRATRSTVDAVAAGHPVMLTAWTGHGTLFNTAALRRLQVRDDEPDPPGGFFVRMPGTRMVTGVAHEYAEYILRQRLSMMPDEQAQAKVLRDTAAAAVGLGITSVQLMATNRPAAQLARTAVAADLPIRVRVIDFPMTGITAWRQPASASVAWLHARDRVGHQMDRRRHAGRTVDAAARAVLRQTSDTRAPQLRAGRYLQLPEARPRPARTADVPRRW